MLRPRGHPRMFSFNRRQGRRIWNLGISKTGEQRKGYGFSAVALKPSCVASDAFRDVLQTVGASCGMAALTPPALVITTSPRTRCSKALPTSDGFSPPPPEGSTYTGLINVYNSPNDELPAINVRLPWGESDRWGLKLHAGRRLVYKSRGAVTSRQQMPDWSNWGPMALGACDLI